MLEALHLCTSIHKYTHGWCPIHDNQIGNVLSHFQFRCVRASGITYVHMWVVLFCWVCGVYGVVSCFVCRVVSRVDSIYLSVWEPTTRRKQREGRRKRKKKRKKRTRKQRTNHWTNQPIAAALYGAGPYIPIYDLIWIYGLIRKLLPTPALRYYQWRGFTSSVSSPYN